MRTEVKLITPDEAKNILRKNTRNVAVNNALIQKYAIAMRAGKWSLTGQGISIAEDGTLIDGQHRLLAILRSGIAQWMLVISELNYDATFNFYDTGRIRGASTILSLYAKNAKVISACINFVHLLTISADTNHLRLSNDQIVETYTLNPTIYDRIAKDARSLYEHSNLVNTSLVAGMMAYLVLIKLRDYEDVYAFFKQLMTGESDSQTVKYTRAFLIRQKTSTRQLKNEARLWLLIKTWNYYIDKKEVSNMTMPTQRVDFI